MRNRLLVLSLAALTFAAAPAALAETRQFTVVNVEFEGTKIWLPATLVVNEGDTVKIKLINNVKTDPNVHGYAIPAFKVAEVVTRGETKEVEFVADKEGIYPINCQLHPAHVGGQLVVIDDD